MPDILIKNFPAELFRRLEEQAECNHRSVNEEVIQILEMHLSRPEIPEFNYTFKPTKPMSDRLLRSARKEGRA